MTGRDARHARARPDAGRPLSLIHTNNSPNPIGIGVSGRSGAFEEGFREGLRVLRPITRLACRRMGRTGRGLLSFVSVGATCWAYVRALTWRSDGRAA